jgi:hypothetical protein
MSNQGNQQFADPKVAFIFQLNSDMEGLYRNLTTNLSIQNLVTLSAFIQRLRISSEEQYKEILEIQTKWTPDNCNKSPKNLHKGITAKEIWGIWRTLSTYMNMTYFKDYERGGKPQQPTDNRMRPL